eukprot:1156926-Pelagomonas_calceolata.AAC.3
MHVACTAASLHVLAAVYQRSRLEGSRSRKRNRKPSPARRPRALRKGPLTSKLAWVSPEGPPA